jgi:hypothetical protein
VTIGAARAASPWVALALIHGCALEGPSEEVCEVSSPAVSTALYLGTEDAGGLPLPDGQPRAIGAVVTSDDASIVCTATVIAPGVALTAAHCARVGGTALRLSETSASVAIRDPIVHPVLDVMVFHFDDAVAKLVQPLALFGGSIGPDWEGELATLAGVGRTETGEVGQLRFVREPIVGVSATEITVDGMGRSGACGGDSGGPLLVEDRSGALSIAGVLDRGAASCLGVDVFVKVEAFADWLRETTAISAPKLGCSTPGSTS